MRGDLSPVYFLWNYLCCIFHFWGNYTFLLMFVWPDSLTSFWLEPCSTLESPWTRTTVSPPPTLVQPPRKASSPREGVIGTESGVLFLFFVFLILFLWEGFGEDGEGTVGFQPESYWIHPLHRAGSRDYLSSAL